MSVIPKLIQNLQFLHHYNTYTSFVDVWVTSKIIRRVYSMPFMKADIILHVL